MTPYWSDDTVSLYLGDCREVLPDLDVTADLMLADPPYGETNLIWDRWPNGWLDTATSAASALWCFGSTRMFGERWSEFAAAGWKLSQDVIGTDEDGAPVFGDLSVVWEKPHGAGMAADRFRRVHEHVLHWYRGRSWRETYHAPPRERHYGKDVSRRSPNGVNGAHLGSVGPNSAPDYRDDGTRLLRSVIKTANMHKRGIHPTEKPIGILDPLIRYACPPGGLVLDPFAGSGSTLDATRAAGRRAIGIEANEAYAEKAARRLDQLTLEAL